MPKIQNLEVLEGWSEEDIKELNECINEQLRGAPKGEYYFVLRKVKRPNVSEEQFMEEIKKCKTLAELEMLPFKLAAEYGVKELPFYFLALVGREPPEQKKLDEGDILLRVKKYR